MCSQLPLLALSLVASTVESVSRLWLLDAMETEINIFNIFCISDYVSAPVTMHGKGSAVIECAVRDYSLLLSNYMYARSSSTDKNANKRWQVISPEKITRLSKKIFDKIPEQQQMVHTDRSCPSWRQDLQVLATRGAEMMGVEGIHIYSMGYRHTVVQTSW